MHLTWKLTVGVESARRLEAKVMASLCSFRLYLARQIARRGISRHSITRSDILCSIHTCTGKHTRSGIASTSPREALLLGSDVTPTNSVVPLSVQCSCDTVAMANSSSSACSSQHWLHFYAPCARWELSTNQKAIHSVHVRHIAPANWLL